MLYLNVKCRVASSQNESSSFEWWRVTLVAVTRVLLIRSAIKFLETGGVC